LETAVAVSLREYVKMRETLAFYADASMLALIRDHGERAREALVEGKKEAT
jgi:hypothetical protein